MNVQFRSFLRPPASLIERLEACDPTNPLHTSEYANALRVVGEQAFFRPVQSQRSAVGMLGCFVGVVPAS